MTRIYAVILAGGGGTRLWPVSRRGRPKQVLPLVQDHSLFAAAIDRLRGWLSPDQILVAAPAGLGELLANEVEDLGPERFLAEPAPRGTAPVLGLAAALLEKRDPQAVMAVLTSDHAIGRADRLRALLEAGADLASSGRIVTLGIPPESADTGYGYIRRGDRLDPVGGEQVYQVAEFKEKPDADTARRYLESGQYYWNSGMFLWQPRRLLQEIERSMPALHHLLAGVVEDSSVVGERAFQDAWRGLSPQTIDYGVMENAGDAVVLDAQGLEWSDIGDWDRVYRLVAGKPGDNAALGAIARTDESSGNLIVTDGRAKLVVLQGVNDLAVIDTGDVLLICRRDQAARVRAIVEALEHDGLDQYLR